MASNSLTAQPLGQQGGFNWIFLVDLIVCMILALFFMFYFNRLFATLVSYAIRAYTWHKFRAYIDITSLQISFLGGRLFFKSIRYHGHNQTVFVHDGYVTWRYWLRQVQDAEIFTKQHEKRLKAESPTTSDDEPDQRSEKPRVKSRNRNRSVSKAEAGNITSRSTLPCRIEVKVSGVEAFLYNQTPIYDNIIANLTGEPQTAAPNGPEASADVETSFTQHSTTASLPKQSDLQESTLEPQQTHSSISASLVSPASTGARTDNPIPAFLRLFPIQIECKKAAAAVGNEHTPSVVTAKVDHASGRIDADEAGSLDLYKLLFQFDFSQVNVSFKPNHDFHMYQLQAAAQLSQNGGPKKPTKGRALLGLHPVRRVRKIVASIRRVLTFKRNTNRSVRSASLLSNDELMDDAAPKLPGEAHWQGLARYLDEAGANEHHEWDNVEYARFSQIVDCEKVRMNFYWDVPGKVHISQQRTAQYDDVNGCAPPEYGLDLFVEGGLVNYGPWADRQRVLLQQMFFPMSYCDAQPAQRRTSGQIRLATVFKLHLCLEKDIVLRVPSREPSKDWEWQGRTETHRKTDTVETGGFRRRRGKSSKKPGKRKKQQQQQQGPGGPDVRPFGWIDVKVLADSTVNYCMDMYSREDGYRNKLDVEVKGTEISSSVNHAMLWRAGVLMLHGDLSNPLSWNDLRRWVFKIECHDLDLFILRDHMFLMTDLIADWSAGPPAEFCTFVPYKYKLKLEFHNFNLFLNGNDANIVNDPSDLEENNFIILRGKQLHADLGIPIDHYRPAQGEVTFDVVGRDLSLDLSNSPKMTLHSLLRDKRVAEMKQLTLTGTQTYFVEQAPGLTDVLRMDICGTDLELRLFGFLIRYFINVKENYFGEFLHFKTLEEYQNLGGDAANAEASAMGRHTFRPVNDLDVILCIKAEHPVIMLPTNIYSAESFIKAELPIASADLRVTNYYLDLQTDISPVAVSWSGLPNKHNDFDSSSPQIFIEHANVVGHRLFGLPPTEPAYVENWDIELGDLSGECSLEFVEHLAKAGRAFAFALADRENTLPLAQTMDVPSIMFLRLNTGSVCIWINDGVAATQVCTDPISVSQNDRADHMFSGRMTLSVPNLTVTCVEAESSARFRLRTDERPAKCMAFVQTSIEVNIVTRRANFKEEYKTQQHHVRRHDTRTRRAQFFLDPVQDEDSLAEEEDGGMNEPPSMDLPGLPLPMLEHQHRSNQGPSSPKSSNGSFRSVRTQPAHHLATYSDHEEDPGLITSLSTSASRNSHSAMASANVNMWSPFSAPDNHISHVNVDLSDIPAFTPTADAEDDVSLLSIDDAGLNLDANDDSEHTTIMVRLQPGIRAYVEPRISEPILNIADAVLPKRPIDLVDKFQIDVMGDVEAGLKQNGSRSTILELNLIVPSVDFRLSNDREGDMATIPSDLTHDRLDITLSYLNLTMRQRSIPMDLESDSGLILHLTLESGLAKLTNMCTGNTIAGDAIHFGVDEVLVWLVLSKTKSVHVSCKDLLIVVSGKQSTYLASVFSKYAEIGISIQKRAEVIQHVAEARLKYLTDYLTRHSSVSSDPPYLSRMTYILRAFPKHFRNQDSWKIIARFRHIYDTLTARCNAELEEAISVGRASTSKPSDTLDQWSEWCSWDIPNIGKTHVFKRLLGDAGDKAPDETVHPMELTLRSETVRIVVDSGKNSSDIFLGSLSLGLQIVPPSRPSGLMLVEENLRTKTTVQAHTAASVLRLNWEILEQADDFIDIYFKRVKHAIESLPEEIIAPSPETDENLFRQDVHIVLSTDRGTIELDTINLRHISEGVDMKTSVIATSKASQEYTECMSVLITAIHASAELRNRDSRIYRTDLVAPSIYLDYRQRADSNAAEINLGGSYGELIINVEQEVLGMLETLDTVIVDEVAYIKGLQQRIAAQQQHSQQEANPGTPAESGKALHFDMAFMAGHFSLSLALLQALNLSISGQTANLKVKPKQGLSMAFDIEAHLGTVEYALVQRIDGSAGHKAVFHTPPATGLIGVQMSDQVVNLAVTTILQIITLEATSVQSALAILNRPEVQSVLEAIRDQITDLRDRVTEVLMERQPVPVEDAPGDSKLVIYDIKTTLAGLKVVANAPALSAGKARAELSFGFGSVRSVISNAGLTDSRGMPNVSANIQDVGALLTLIENGKRQLCGHVLLSIKLDCASHDDISGVIMKEIKARSDAFEIHVYPATASTIVDIVTHVQRKILDLDLSREVEYLRRLRHSREKRKLIKPSKERPSGLPHDTDKFVKTKHPNINFSLDLRKIRVAWIVTEAMPAYDGALHDLELSFTRISLTIQKQDEARLSMQNLQLQVAPKNHPDFDRAENSALLPEVVFTVRYRVVPEGVKIAFNAAGQALDLRLDAGFVQPVSMIQRSIAIAVDKYYVATSKWRTESNSAAASRRNPFGDKRLITLQADAKFDGATFYIQGDPPPQFNTSLRPPTEDGHRARDRYGPRRGSKNVIDTSLRAPGIALKIDFVDPAENEATLNGELKVDASSNTVYPQLVPIILQISDNVKAVVRNAEKDKKKPSLQPKAPPQATQDHILGEDSLLTKDPSAIIGKMKLNLGLRICQQEFGLSCQPIARVNAKAQLEDIYITMNTINSDQFGHFFALSATFTKLAASVQHVYSRESTFSFNMESIAISLMNSKHLGAGSSGVSAVLKIAPTRTALNIRQVQDLLLFREIWFPQELRSASAFGSTAEPHVQEDMLVEKYKQVSAAAAFPWNATISIADLAVDLELGQSIGKSSFTIKNMWACSRKSSTWKQDLCVGLDQVGIQSTGRMSGFVDLSDIAVRTSIEWPSHDSPAHKAPLIQAAAGFGKLRAKSSFDYQPFAFVDVEEFNLLMYNVRNVDKFAPDRLVAILDGDKVFAFCSATSAAQAVGLYQAFDRLVQEKQAAYMQSMRDLEKQLQRRSVSQPHKRDGSPSALPKLASPELSESKHPITLHTDVVVKLRAISFGAFPGTFFDNQIFKLEASDVQARFAVGLQNQLIHSNLGMTLGQLQVALASVKKVSVPKTLGDISIDEVIANATSAKGGTILRVPKVVASMQTWQSPEENQIDYIFRSLFDGKVDVGWNYSRISFIRGMWNTHSRSLAKRLGKPLPESAVKIKSPPGIDEKDGTNADAAAFSAEQQGKITAVVNVPQSRYEYRALEEPIIETPQLRDMGEATPPLEWIGLQRDKLPNVVHQIVIVTLLEVAKEVEDAYGRILGSS